MNILITGSRHTVGCMVARDLATAGHTVYAADSVSFDYVRFSRALAGYFGTPSARFDESGYINTIRNIIREQKIDHIVPLGEEVFYLSLHEDELRQVNPLLTFHAGTIDQLESLHNKHRLVKLAAGHDIQVPDTRRVRSAKDVIDYQTTTHRHVVLKPMYSRFANQVIELRDIDRKTLDTIDWSLDYIVQEYIDGQVLSSYSFDYSEPALCYQGSVQTTTPCAMPAIEKIEPLTAAREIDRTLRRALGYHGQLGLDFIQTAHGLYLIEANPRATLGYALRHERRQQSRLMLFHLWSSGLIRARHWLRAFWIFLTYPDVLFRIADPLPAIASQCIGLTDYLRFLWRENNASMRSYATHDMQYNGRPPAFVVAEATQHDNTSILSLLEKTLTSGGNRVIYTRQPNALASLARDSQSTKIGVIRDQHGSVVIMGACATRSYIVGTQTRQVGYISDVRKDPLFRYKIPWLDMFIDAFRSSGPELLYCSMMRSNRHARAVFSKPRRGVPPLQHLAAYSLFIINPFKFPVKRLPHGVSFGQLSDQPPDVTKTVVAFIERESRRYDLFPIITHQGQLSRDLSTDNCFVLSKGDDILGFAYLNDQRDTKQFIVKRYAWYARLLKLANPLLARLHLMPLPVEDAAANCPAISFVLVRDDDTKTYTQLMGQLMKVVKKTTTMCMITVPESSPHHSLFVSPYNVRVKNDLYVMNFSQQTAKVDNPYTEASILF